MSQKKIFRVRKHFNYYILRPHSTKPKQIIRAGELIELDSADEHRQANKLEAVSTEAFEDLKKEDEECGCENAAITAIGEEEKTPDAEAESGLSTTNTLTQRREAEENTIEKDEPVEEAAVVEVKKKAKAKLLKRKKRTE